MQKMAKMGIALLALLYLGSALALGAGKITWEHILLGPGGGFMMIKIDPRNDDVVYISSDMSNWGKSVDGGKTWIDLTSAQLEATGVGGVQDYGLLIDPKDSNTLYLASGGVAKSVDGGKSWKLIYDARSRDGISASSQRMAMDPTDSKVMYMGDRAGNIIKTENAGDAWAKMPEAGWGQPPLNIGVGHDRAVYVGICNKGLFKSADGGRTWTTNNNGLPHLEIGSFQVAVEKDQTVLYALLVQTKPKQAGGNLEGGLYRSGNGAATWEKVKVLDDEKYKGHKPPIWCQLAVSPVNSAVVYLTAYEVQEKERNNGTYRTLDGGKTWEFLPGKYDRNLLGWGSRMYPYIMTGYGDVFAVSPKNPKKLYRADQICMYRSDDGGENWKILSQEDAGEGYYRSTGLEDMGVLGIVADPKDRRRVYVGAADNGFLKSRDGGKTWKGSFNQWIRAERTDQILVDPDAPATLYLGHTLFKKGTTNELVGHFIISRDYGETWEKSELHPEWGLPEKVGIVALALDPDSPADARVLYVSLLGEGVWKTENGGMNWKPCHQGLPEVTRAGVSKSALGRQIIQLLKPKGTGLVYAVVCEKAGLFHNYSSISSKSVEGNGLYLSENRGATWRQIKFEGPVPAVIKKIAVCPTNPAILYAAGGREGVWKSADRGQMWQKVLGTDYPGVAFNHVVVDHFNSSRVYAAGEKKYSNNYGVWLSEDGGNTWTHENKGFGHWIVQALYADPTAEGIIWAGTFGNAVFKGYVKGMAVPKGITEPARSPLEEKAPQKP